MRWAPRDNAAAALVETSIAPSPSHFATLTPRFAATLRVTLRKSPSIATASWGPWERVYAVKPQRSAKQNVRLTLRWLSPSGSSSGWTVTSGWLASAHSRAGPVSGATSGASSGTYRPAWAGPAVPASRGAGPSRLGFAGDGSGSGRRGFAGGGSGSGRRGFAGGGVGIHEGFV